MDYNAVAVQAQEVIGRSGYYSADGLRQDSVVRKDSGMLEVAVGPAQVLEAQDVSEVTVGLSNPEKDPMVSQQVENIAITWGDVRVVRRTSDEEMVQSTAVRTGA